jgi:hypothetical protein
MRTRSLKLAGVTNSEYGGVSATQKLGRYFSVFANYTASRQLSSSVLSEKAIHGATQTVSFGIEYSPREWRFRR